MPVLDGLNVIRCLRAMPATWNLPVVVLTGSAGEESQDQCMEAGASAFVAKPCDLAELMNLPGSLLGWKNDDPGPEAE
jgi:CheY-like chemotaxis protein